MAGVRITLHSFPGPGASPEVIDTATFASPTAAVAGIATGFLVVTPSATVDGHALPQVAINSTAIQTIIQT